MMLSPRRFVVLATISWLSAAARASTPKDSAFMAPIPLHGRRLFTAEVDCDEGDTLRYRATSTCHVAFMPLNSTHFYYSSFILRNHATSTSGIDVQAVLAIWESLTIAPGKQD